MRKAWRCWCYSLDLSLENMHTQSQVVSLLWWIISITSGLSDWCDLCVSVLKLIGFLSISISISLVLFVWHWVVGMDRRKSGASFSPRVYGRDCSIWLQAKGRERRSTGIDPLSLAVSQPCVVALDLFAAPHLSNECLVTTEFWSEGEATTQSSGPSDFPGGTLSSAVVNVQDIAQFQFGSPWILAHFDSGNVSYLGGCPSLLSLLSQRIETHTGGFLWF